MLTEKPDMNSLIKYVMEKHKPLRLLTLEEQSVRHHAVSTHVVYEISGDATTKTLTRVGEARPGGVSGDYELKIYPQFSVSGELVLIRIHKEA